MLRTSADERLLTNGPRKQKFTGMFDRLRPTRQTVKRRTPPSRHLRPPFPLCFLSPHSTTSQSHNTLGYLASC